jgi:2-polyprenyl-3-methyl-5-hydroxy-6-metoxy-1,4-benzoquinol methylase
MWYPGVPTFAETSCVAAVEAQACGTPFVGSLKGALPETCPSGVFIAGDAFTRGYQQQSVDAVVSLLEDCKHDRRRYRDLQKAGRAHVQRYTYDAIAAEWESWIAETFEARYEGNKLGVLRQLLHHDDHTAAKIVAEEAIGDDGLSMDGVDEARAASEFCDSVIAGKEHTAETYAACALDPIVEIESNHARRLAVTAQVKGCKRILDVACGSGAYAIGFCQADPDVHVVAVDYSQGNIDAAKAAAEKLGFADRIEWICAPVWDFAQQRMSDWWVTFTGTHKQFDAVWCGEFVEHVSDYQFLIDSLDGMTARGGKVVITVPYGPLGDYKGRTEPHPRSHVHHFRADDVSAVFGQKAGLHVECLPWPGVTSREGRCGNWLITYTASTAPTGRRPYEQTILTTRPYARLSVGIIAANAAFDIAKCLDSVWWVADEIVIGLCDSTDETRQIAETFDVKSLRHKIRVIDLPAVNDLPDGFSEARNAVLAQCTGEWFLWIDTDETLISSHSLVKYLDAGAYQGFVIRQNHLQLDAPNHFDTPIRLFKRKPEIQFYGCVHEQPQYGDSNGEIVPALEVADATLAHLGYLVTSTRRHKLFQRNLPLVARDQERFPDRRLGKLLVARDCVHLGDEDTRLNGDQLTEDAVGYYRRAVQLFDEHFAAPEDKFHDLARPFYERALRALGLGTEVEWALAGKPGGLNGGHAKPHRFWVQTATELERIVQHKLQKAYAQMTPKPPQVEPVVVPQPVEVTT